MNIYKFAALDEAILRAFDFAGNVRNQVKPIKQIVHANGVKKEISHVPYLIEFCNDTIHDSSNSCVDVEWDKDVICDDCVLPCELVNRYLIAEIAKRCPGIVKVQIGNRNSCHTDETGFDVKTVQLHYNSMLRLDATSNIINDLLAEAKKRFQN